MAHDGVDAVGPLVQWLQEQNWGGEGLHGDFLWISALHGALFQAIGAAGLGFDGPLRYPSQLAQRLCHDQVANVYECRHGVGHGVLYATLLRQHGSLANYSACRQPRPYSLTISNEMWDAVWAMCREAETLPTSNQEFSFAQGCTSGASHSGYLFDTRLAEYGRR